MDSKIIILTISLFLSIYAIFLISKKNKKEIDTDSIIDSIIKEDKVLEKPIENNSVDIGNVLNKKKSKNAIYGSRNKILLETDSSSGGFNYGKIQGIIKKNTEWAQSGVKKAYEKRPDIQPNYLYSLNKNKNVKYFDKHFVKDGHKKIGDVPSSEIKERYKYTNIALSQLNNAKANSYKNNIDLDSVESKEMLTFSKSKILAPSFSFGYLDSKNPISLKSGIPVNKDLPPDVKNGVENFTEEVKSNENKIIYKII